MVLPGYWGVDQRRVHEVAWLRPLLVLRSLVTGSFPVLGLPLQSLVPRWLVTGNLVMVMVMVGNSGK